MESSDAFHGRITSYLCQYGTVIYFGNLIRAAGSGMGFQGGGKSRASSPMISNMAGPIYVKLSGIVEDTCQMVLVKEKIKK